MLERLFQQLDNTSIQKYIQSSSLPAAYFGLFLDHHQGGTGQNHNIAKYDTDVRL
jgi:hypothetical protein